MNLRLGALHNVRTTPGTRHFQWVAQSLKDGGNSRRDSGAIIDDEIMKLVRRLFVSPDVEKTAAVVAFCGVDEGAGCSWVCARAGEVLADQAPGSVCMVDANLRSPSLHSRFHIEKGVGFADAIKGTEPIHEFAQHVGERNLLLITAGSTGTEPNGALNPARLRSRFSELRHAFDFVLVDTPATSIYADATLLSQLTDGVVLVVGSNSTRRETARAAKRGFEAARVPIFGAVLNKRTFPIPEALYWKL